MRSTPSRTALAVRYAALVIASLIGWRLLLDLRDHLHTQPWHELAEIAALVCAALGGRYLVDMVEAIRAKTPDEDTSSDDETGAPAPHPRPPL